MRIAASRKRLDFCQERRKSYSQQCAPHNIAMEGLVHKDFVRRPVMLALPREATSAYIEDSCSKMASARQQHHPMPSPLPHGEQPVCQQCLVWFPVALIRVQQGSPYLEDLLSCKKHPIP